MNEFAQGSRGSYSTSTIVPGLLAGSQLSILATMAPNLHSHGLHPGCCVTSDFQHVVEDSWVATLVVDPTGHVIYANASAAKLIGYGISELTEKHITEIVEAAPDWVASEFQHLVDNQTWSGKVLFRPAEGGLVKASVNAFSRPLPTDGAEHIAFLHSTFPDGPAIDRLPATDLARQLRTPDLALLHLITAGFGDAEIAGIRGTDEPTVKEEVKTVREKLHVASRTEAAIVAMRERLVA